MGRLRLVRDFTCHYPVVAMRTIAIIGGSGPEGRGLGLRWAMAGHHIILGSRDADRAAEAADGLAALREGISVSGALNAEAARAAEWVAVSVPFEGLDATVSELALHLAGKLVISVVAPLAFEEGMASAVAVPEGSAAELMQQRLPSSRVTSGFQNLSAKELLQPDKALDGDIIICGDDEQAKADTIGLAEAIASLRGIDGGPLANSRTVEGLTALLLYVNRKAKGRATVRLLGL